MRRTAPLLIVLAVVLSVFTAPLVTAQSSACGLQQAAFCETFDASNPSVDRAGPLEHVVWGVSRTTSDSNNGANLFDHWSSARLTACGQTTTVSPPNDAVICNGRLAEAINDNDNTNIWAAYPRQPFDIAGRTGKVTFDVGNDSQGPHAAWPAFMFTDQPVPAPYGGIAAPGVNDYARNSIGFSLANGPCVDDMFMTKAYVSTTLAFVQDGCVAQPSAAQIAAGQLNHYEVDLTATSMTVYATDPGSTTLKKIAHVSGITVPLTRGLVWIEDVHYNGGKFNNQRNHTFVWDNVGFDGPVLPRDLGFSVPDAKTPKSNGLDGLPTFNLGYQLPANVSTSLPMTAGNIAAASAALLELTWYPYNQQTLTYSLNGHTSHSVPWPYPGDYTFASQTVAFPVALSELQPGVQAIHLQSTDWGGVSNIDLILVGAGSGGGSTPVPTDTPQPPATATATATSTVVPTDTPTPVPSATATVTPTSTPVPPATCQVLAMVNGVQQLFNRPAAFCADQ